MNVLALDIFLGTERAGLLFQYGTGRTALTRFIPDAAFWSRADAPVFSWAAEDEDPQRRELFWRSYVGTPFFNAEGGRLPAFFQNLLPEGPLRRHLEELRGCGPNDHFDLLATCGTDLPGNVYAYPAHLDADALAAVVTQRHDALEMTVTADPLPEATSLSGVQPKLALVAHGGRYVARTKDVDGTHIIAKLPTAEYALLPEVEDLSLRLAQAAGVEICEAWLAPLDDITAGQPFVLGESRQFLAVKRFDRGPGAHIHCEDFAQILRIPPDEKYSHPAATYAAMTSILREAMGLAPAVGDAMAEELIRRVMVNEMLGNYDAHVKNFGVVYRDGRTPALSPAYDVVAYAAYLGGRGHALRFVPGGEKQARLTPATLRSFCNATGLLETRIRGVLNTAVGKACESWPALIAASSLLPKQKQNLLAHFENCDAVKSWRARSPKRRLATVPPDPVD
ncbi:MAG: type II toxin-antitoxin system HipA family toxin [Comamonadaceae bacterium]|nr:MAG: type II toxin-antitoxin system HipA family toxin [Comamonadaceae bacterium]